MAVSTRRYGGLTHPPRHSKDTISGATSEFLEQSSVMKCEKGILRCASEKLRQPGLVAQTLMFFLFRQSNRRWCRV